MCCDLTNAINNDEQFDRETDLKYLRELKMAKNNIDQKIKEIEKKLLLDELKPLDIIFSIADEDNN
jgi:hypothetical protein